MSFESEYLKLRKKRLKEQKEQILSGDIAPTLTVPRLASYGAPKSKAEITTQVEATKRATAEREHKVAEAEAKAAEEKNTFLNLKTIGDVVSPLKDGFQLSDIASIVKKGGEAATATFADIGLGILKGAGKTLEGVSDLALQGTGLLADKIGGKLMTEVGNYAREAAATDFIDEIASPIDDELDRGSLIGNKTEGVEEALGQIGLMIVTGGVSKGLGLGAKAANAVNTGLTFASSTGQGVTEAYKSGATEEEAWAYGVLTGSVDAGTEAIFGGLGKSVEVLGISRGIGGLDDIFAKKLTSKINNVVARNVIEGTIKATGEGLEEVLAGCGDAVAKKLTYMSDEELSQLIENENLLEQFVVGTVASSIAQTGSVTKSTKAGQDYVTGFTQNEEAVINKEVERRIAEKEAKGETVSAREKNKIYDKVVEDLDKGYISIDTIEEALGGDSYKTYKDTVSSEDAIVKEYNELADIPENALSRNQRKRLDELEAQIEDAKNRRKSIEAKSKLDDTISSLIGGGRLRESYNEKARRGEFFNPDVSKYDKKMQATIKRAVDSGVLNDTNRTYEFVESVANLESKTGVFFDFANNKKLRELGLTVEGATVNGVFTGNGITINVDSPKAWESTVGHELTHVLKESNAELYGKLQSAVFEYAKTKGVYDSRLKFLTELYKNVENADIDAELTADLIGDYLFTDDGFVSHLCTVDRNVFQKIYDEIKRLLKLVTPKSKEARQLEKVKQAFDKAYKKVGKAQKNTADGGVKYSLSGINKYGIEVYETSQEIMNLTWAERKAKYLDVMKNEYRGRTAKFERNGHTYYAEFDQNSIRKPIYGDSRSSPDGAKALIKVGADGDVFDLVENSQYRRSRPNTKDHTDADYFDYFVKTIQIDGKVFDLVADVEKKHGEDGGYVYTLALTDNKRIKASPTHGHPNYGPVKNAGNASDNSIPHSDQNVNRKNSLSYPDDFAPIGNRHTPATELRLENAHPVREDLPKTQKKSNTAENTDTEQNAVEGEFEASEIATSFETSKEGEEESDAKESNKAKERPSRKKLHNSIIENVKTQFSEKGFNFDSVLKKAKNLSTFKTVDNTPQRVMEKALGYKEGQILADLTVNKVAQNETEGIKWLNSYTNRKNGLLAQISKQYGIKPGSKESAAAQMYAEGFYVGKSNDIIKYGPEELLKDFPDAETRQNIKGLASDPRIRQIYDDTLNMINESRVRNGYPAIQKIDNYFLHFRAMDDTFSKLGLPFNPNDIRAKDLPTDLNGVTADLKPGQPYFASAMHRTGNRTSFDLLGGLERYLSSAKNQIYHIDDIQTLRALRNYVADTYGQANGLDGLDDLPEEEVQERIKQVYNSHLSSFAKFLNEEANILAGKTALIDRGIEGIIGRRGITFLKTVNSQVGSNMVGFNASSSLTNFLATVQAFAKTQKRDFTKAFGQMVANKVGSVFGNNDSFAENSPVIIRRKGADRFYRTPWQKAGDAGYFLMSAADNISTELIARTKYNEFTRKGMDSQQAHYETDKWVSRLMGDRSLGQMPQLYNSQMLGLVTKFQLEVRNQLDSQFYDTIQEANASNKDIENGLKRNARTAAKVASTFFQLAVAQHLFGKAFEAVAGYNPAFDIIDVIIKTFGFDDDEESEDTALDNIEEGFLTLLEDLPYTSIFTGGRIPIASALPIEELVTGKDEYGNEKSRLETIGEAVPYYLLPTGYGQAKKTAQGLSMFSDDHPIAGSYTDSGNLRFPVDDTLGNRIQSGLFGQYASKNAKNYFDNERTPLSEKQIEELIDSDMTIDEYWNYRDGLKKCENLAEKADYINSLDLTTEQKNVLINNIANRKDEIDMSDYDLFEDFEEFDFAIKNPEKYAVSKAIGTYKEYSKYSKALSEIKADKYTNGQAVSGSRKKKVAAYIKSLDIDYGQKLILFKSEYTSDDTYNFEIVEYLNEREDIPYDEKVLALKELGFNIENDGRVTWD